MTTPGHTGWTLPLEVFDPLAAGRSREPVEMTLHFREFRPVRGGLALTDARGRGVACQIVASGEGADGRLDWATLCFGVDLPAGAMRTCFDLHLLDRAAPPAEEGIRLLEPQLEDGFRRLDTGVYELELCRGTARGNGGSKWGIRHFEHKDQRLNLIEGNRNAFGGVYGPFFTPENGLVNPPAHAVATIEPLTEGPVTCQYRLKVDVPDGLRPELRGKRIEILWRFYHGSPCFARSYFVDDFETEIDGRRCRNRITVGDEIESGKGRLALDSYEHHDGTAYRPGDLYAEILLGRIRDLRQREPEVVAKAMGRLGIDPSEDPASWHWDNYWRLFCVIEQALPEEVLRDEVERIWREANRIVWSDRDHNLVRFARGPVDVNAEPQQTVFALNARRTCEASSATGYAFVRHVNRPVPRMQIVQRRDSGWVNWGTNGENEYPELPTGSTIRSAYGRFDDWRVEADRLGTRLAVAVGDPERDGRPSP